MKYLITPKSQNPITGPIPVTTSPRSTCPRTCPFIGDVCYAEQGALGGFIWTLLDRTPVGQSFAQHIRVHSFTYLLLFISRLPKGALWRHNQAGDLHGKDGTIDVEHLRLVTKANQGRKGFTFTHYDILANAKNRMAIAEANQNGFTINLSGNSLAHADALFDIDVAPVTTVLPPNQKTNTRTPKNRKVVICPARTRQNVTCSTCKLCTRSTRDFIIGFPAVLPSKRTFAPPVHMQPTLWDRVKMWARAKRTTL